MNWKPVFAATTLLAAGISQPALAKGTAATPTAPEADRRAILAMAGTYKVKFDFREQTVFTPGYTPIDPKISGGREVVRVVEDTGNHIVLQHILVVKDPKDAAAKPFVIKHWRQDWTYQPSTVLTYRGMSVWAEQPVSRTDSTGAWSQTVWQTDDSPRYGGIGRWTHDGGVDSWTSQPTWRPLARRDAVRHPVYDRYYGVNRHALTPAGWVHEQRNDKIGLQNGKLVTFVDETVINTYDKFSDFDVAAADTYWARTKGYWARVRAAWNAKFAGGKPVTVTEVAETGSITGEKLMGWADEIADGKLAPAEAEKQATNLIGGLTTTKVATR